MIDRTGRPLILNIRAARRLASHGRRSPIVDKIAAAVKPITQTVSATDKRAVAPNAPSAQTNCEVVEPQPKAQTSPNLDRVVRRIPLSDVAMDAGHRVDAKNVEILTESFRHAGQTSAILVVREEYGRFRVIRGIHRVIAAREVGWVQIDAVVLDCDKRGQRLIAIADKLHRRELPALERAELTYEWIQLIHHEAMQDARPSGGRQPNDRGLSKAARALGVTKEETMRSARIASISPEGKSKARELGFQDNQAVLLQVAELTTPDLQIARLHAISEGKKASRGRAGAHGVHAAQRGEREGSSAITSNSVQQLEPEQDLPIPEALDRRDVEAELGRLTLQWKDFRRFLVIAPLAARRRFVRDVLMRDSLIQHDVADSLRPKLATAGEQSRAT